MITITFAEDFDKPEHTARDLAEWYNANRGEADKAMPVYGYRTKAQTINACKQLMKGIDAQIEFEEETEGMTDEEVTAYFMGGLVKEDDEPKEKVKVERQPNERRASNADGISASWKDEKIKTARTTRNKVKVTWKDGSEVYRSAGSAFAALGLPDSKCIRFRLKLKASGVEVFEHAGEKYTFEIVEG